MPSESEVQNIIGQLKGSGKTFAEFLAELFKDKFIEIYLGDSFEEVSVDQISTSYPAIFCGKVVAAYRECLIINAAFAKPVHKNINKNAKTISMGNLMFINERAIRALNEVDGNGTIKDMLLRSQDSLEIKKIFGNE